MLIFGADGEECVYPFAVCVFFLSSFCMFVLQTKFVLLINTLLLKKSPRL